MNHQEQTKIVDLFNQGDKNAFAAIYNEFGRGIFAYTKHLLKGNQDAEDIVAETFFKLWKARGHFETVEKLHAFLHVTAKNGSIDHLRRLKMQSAKQAEIRAAQLDAYENIVPEDPGIEQLLSQIYIELEKLPRRFRDLIKLSYFEGLKNAEIASRLGISEKTVRNQKVKAHEKLRMKIFEKKGLQLPCDAQVNTI